MYSLKINMKEKSKLMRFGLAISIDWKVLCFPFLKILLHHLFSV